MCSLPSCCGCRPQTLNPVDLFCFAPELWWLPGWRFPAIAPAFLTLATGAPSLGPHQPHVGIWKLYTLVPRWDRLLGTPYTLGISGWWWISQAEAGLQTAFSLKFALSCNFLEKVPCTDPRQTIVDKQKTF